jgi:hypothetical protein
VRRDGTGAGAAGNRNAQSTAKLKKNLEIHAIRSSMGISTTGFWFKSSSIMAVQYGHITKLDTKKVIIEHKLTAASSWSFHFFCGC